MLYKFPSIRSTHIFCVALFAFSACTSDNFEFKKIEKYYKKNKELHQSMQDSLAAFCKSNGTKVNLIRSHYDQSIAFHIYFPSGSKFLPIYFDSSLQRRDEHPETKKYVIPVGLIENFSKSFYIAARADSISTFFAHEWKSKLQPGTQGDAQYGLLMSADTSALNKWEKRLDDKACLAISSAY